MNKTPLILGIESSCDDTSAAILQGQKILSNIVANQEVHTQYGGVVPELASRAHQQNIIPVVDAAIKKANINKEDITAIAFTKGPGLLGSLLVGSSFSKSFAMGMDIPLIAVNHMQGHILSHFIDEEETMPQFPFLCLTVSGGHTQIVQVDSPNKMEVIGTTIDDAAGEAFDKSAKVLGLPYPGGPLIDKYAKKGDIHAFEFGKPKIKGLDFSFSGLKTSILYKIQNNMQKNPKFIEENLANLCASIQHSIVSILLNKLEEAIKQTGIKELAIAGGVSANSYLRSELKNLAKNKGYQLYIPKFEYCTDNAAMIAIAGYFKYLDKDFADQSETPSARLPF
ncbi:tRNA (adenosine(37)-N6)-threonylcarbamoyltransferase complex transferase subunit TsaD [Flavobacteriales bacterium]|jgi:N6-L-threonylcarbamoyladenine synthase|nr:tRNA (adenosine(37)-N6)-threonylcarbamoyltransferase complex transferase subunit TsaD [Flavobacteriales bacterium]MDC3306009.1 tRNA (adenosine(37)-N6)-threonylcarbamoyltransferase complex transferase subunit TsaD [Flavobacteriales bacterium]MDG1348110.1 tRNA (adenosine(37)-N6)-threonylcarbamoyltransferase complex transferase subunit TsaD [Flavobacteriales bacterium]|tara:strand:- start:1774 stop:2790 length:1017 start_codon:yes stop_codon:yes gene_type:complete